MKKYHLTNNIIGWVIGIIACAVYVLTAEITGSWWDCGEYIATAHKLQVGHPPGAPSFQLIGCLFSMFSSPETVGHAVNCMSAICSGLTIMFLFWGITLLGKHLLPDPQNPSLKDFRTWAVFGSGIVGALCYTFTDTFWFSAVEGEVYAMSSFFTSLVFWIILKWEEQSDDPRSLRWMVLIGLLVGFSIGVHLLNLLTLPAICYVVYFKKWPKTTVKGFIITGVISVVLLGLILWGIIPGIVNVASAFDVFFVNTLNLPFNSGTIFFFVVLIAAIVWGLWFTHKRNYRIANAGILSFLMLLVGYSTFFVLVIRSNTNTPLNENAPKDAVALRAYLGREQYGDTPLFSGQQYTAGDPIDAEQGYCKYIRGKDNQGNDAYIPAAYAMTYKYRKEHTTLFPRMYSNDNGRQHPQFYKYWVGDVAMGQKPSSAQNIAFFNKYQMGWMYWRYFMWNFAGRQNDIQGHHFNDDGTIDYINGNWISGIKFIDEARLGPQDNLPDYLKNNKARNRYYMLPLLLGLFGLVYHVIRNRKDAFIVLIMFVMTGIAIGIYLNMPPRQPRERDYAFVGSFCFFAIWVGLGVMALADWITRLFKNNQERVYKYVLGVVFVLSMLGVPVLMANENWDDHDRSQKYAARDFAENYIRSLKQNSILITFGDNDTFPLWYAQEVEGIRTDVRILNYTLSGMHWYVQQLYNKLYESDPVPFTLPKEWYDVGRDMVYIRDNSTEYMEVTDVLTMMKEHPERFALPTRDGQFVYFIPTKRFKITVDVPALVREGVVPAELASTVPPEIRWEIGGQVLYRHELMALDIIGTNKFHRDICIMNPSYLRRSFPVVNQYCIQDGMNFKLVPYKDVVTDPATGQRTLRRYTKETYDYFLKGWKDENGEYHPLKWGNLSADIYVDPVSLNMGNVQRQGFMYCAEDLYNAGDTARARQFCDICENAFPAKNFPRDKYSLFMVDLFNKIYGKEKAYELWDQLFAYYQQNILYYQQFHGKKARGVYNELAESYEMMRRLAGMVSGGPLKDETRFQNASPLAQYAMQQMQAAPAPAPEDVELEGLTF